MCATTVEDKNHDAVVFSEQGNDIFENQGSMICSTNEAVSCSVGSGSCSNVDCDGCSCYSCQCTLTTLEYKLTDTYGSCYDRTGVSCTCTGTVSLFSQSLTGTIPAELSACTDVATLYVVPIVTRSCCPSPQLVLLPIDNSCLSCPRCVGRRGMVA